MGAPMIRQSSPTTEQPPLPVASPPPVETVAVGLLECDAFCDCGYNMFRQVVVKDARLGFSVVRCPECGAWHPAGHGATAASVWLTRLAKLLLLAWVALLLAIGAAAVLVQMGLNMFAYEEVFSPRRYEYYAPYQDQSDDLFWQVMFLLMPLTLGAALGLLQSVAAWHARPVARLVPVLVVLVLAGFLSTLPLQSGFYAGYVELCLIWIVVTSAVTGVAWIAMLNVGRPLARAIITLLVPPGPRQYLAFLWHADGKPAPKVSEPKR